MLLQLYPRVHRRYSSLSVLSPIVENFGSILVRVLRPSRFDFSFRDSWTEVPRRRYTSRWPHQLITRVLDICKLRRVDG